MLRGTGDFREIQRDGATRMTPRGPFVKIESPGPREMPRSPAARCDKFFLAQVLRQFAATEAVTSGVRATNGPRIRGTERIARVRFPWDDTTINHTIREEPPMTIVLGMTSEDTLLSRGGFEDQKKNSLGLPRVETPEDEARERERLLRYINLQLIARGLPTAMAAEEQQFAGVSRGLLKNFQHKNRLLLDHRCPADGRIEAFLAEHFADVAEPGTMRLPGRTFILDYFGIARELSLPADGDEYLSEEVQSYRTRNGVLHNPKHDRRTTVGTFHVAEGGLPIAGDKRAVPRAAFAKLFQAAVAPPRDLLELPFTAHCEEKAYTWVSLLLRPLVCPAVGGVGSEMRMEVRFFAPGRFVSNLDFVESIFGNAGDPDIPENDAGLDVEHWSGHSGAVILAPHLIDLTKRELGLPHVSDATERQRKDRMCWESEDEKYNDGTPFKATCRTDAGVVVTLIADNYFGYCKKEVKTQISYAANLHGGFEEEHSGGALTFPSHNLGDDVQVDSVRYNGQTFEKIVAEYPDLIEVQPEGYGIDRIFPDLIYIPEDAFASLADQNIRWERDGQVHRIPLLPGQVYMAPSGYQLRMEKHPAAPSWRLVGTAGEGVFCHKPCTVSGGGKSEISKSLRDYMHSGPFFVADIEQDIARVREIFEKDYRSRWAQTRAELYPDDRPSRKLLDPARSLGSVIKLLTPSSEYNEEYNRWLETIPNHIYSLVFIIKRFHRPEWGDDWESHFGVDIVNGAPGHELKYHERQLVATYLRVGLLGPTMWRTYKVRQDFIAAKKIQTEDDISVSVVIPGHRLGGLGEDADPSLSYKFVKNCEYRLFQRPDDAIHRGLDKNTELDLSHGGNFISNFEPLTRDQVAEMARKVVDFDAFSAPMQKMLRDAIESQSSYVVCSANPRRVGGMPTKNPRYLQTRPDLEDPMSVYVAELGTRFSRKLGADVPVHQPVNAVLVGRRNNPPDPEQGIRSLAVYSPIHYQELPELFMDFVCSLTGKSPSTTGAGSEGALTKGPFNMLRPAADLNAALVDFILTGLAGYSSAAGHIGPNVRVDHDISLIIPEIWSRLRPEERDPEFLIRGKFLEKLEDFEFEGRHIPASRLGYRITYRFVRQFFGRVFDNPGKVFDQAMLQPESQDQASFADGILYIAEAHERVARQYFEDGSIEELCPPLKVLLTIMAHGTWEGRSVRDPEVRAMFSRKALLESDWYHERLRARQQRDIELWSRHVNYLEEFANRPGFENECLRLDIAGRQQLAQQRLREARSHEYLESLRGTIGAQPPEWLRK
jgi:phosphoenolpyruvate carboxykinase (diphosphate)